MMPYQQYEFETPLSVVGDVSRTDSEADAAVGVSYDEFELGVVAPQLSLIPGFDEMFDSIEDQWQDRALCAQTDPEAFFPEKGGSTREAKRICLGCEVRGECLDYALANDERFGIWGGLSERERRRLKRGVV
ncbi:Transcriptional regulator WhiB [Prescottella defluvii]